MNSKNFSIYSLVSTMRIWVAALLLPLVIPAYAVADRPPREDLRERIPIEPMPEYRVDEPRVRERSDWIFNFSTGISTLFFEKEANTIAPVGYFSVRNRQVPLNFRVGIEGKRIDSRQDRLHRVAAAKGKDKARITYLRIPFAIEYVMDFEPMTFFVGGGPNILRMNRLDSDTAVGLHLSVRGAYAITDWFEASLEAGYLNADVESDEGYIDWDIKPFLTTMVGFNF